MTNNENLLGQAIRNAEQARKEGRLSSVTAELYKLQGARAK